MSENKLKSKAPGKADWLFQGVLTRLGDTFDRFTGRRWTPSSSLATSELVERIKAMLDREAQQTDGLGYIVPHRIRLKVQWDKFSTENDEMLTSLENELLTATIDHINNKLYYTTAPVSLEVKADYFIDGVKLSASFDDDTDNDAETSVTLPFGNQNALEPAVVIASGDRINATFSISGEKNQLTLDVPADKRITVGRTGGNLLTIDDVSVSKYHASIGVSTDGQISVSDLGSTNGTFINNERLGYGAVDRLSADDKLRFGSVAVELEYLPAPRSENDLDEVAPDAVTVNGIEFKTKTPNGQPPVDLQADEESGADADGLEDGTR